VTSWSTREEKIINDFCYMGVEEVRQIIYEVTGKRRSVSSIKMHASRMGLSLCSYEVCPQCGRFVKKLKRNRYSDGLCDLCYERSFTAPNVQRSEILARIHGDEPTEEEMIAARRERDRIRKQRQIDREKKCY